MVNMRKDSRRRFSTTVQMYKQDEILRTLPPAGKAYGHFGEWLQGRLGAEGPVVLVTLRCDTLFAQAWYESGPNLELSVSGPAAVSRQHLSRLLCCLQRPQTGRFVVSANVPQGVGAGASTAALVALGRAVGADDGQLAAACLHVEKATDPLMLARPDGVVWASRQARIYRHLKTPPKAEILGGYFGPPIWTDAQDDRFADISDLLAAWGDATDAADLAKIAQLATEAADRTTQLRGPLDDPSAALAHKLGALGYVRAHTGSARGFIFAPGCIPVNAQNALRDAGMQGITSFTTGSAI